MNTIPPSEVKPVELFDLVDTSRFTRRDDVALLIPPGGIAVELGVAEGIFSERVLQRSAVGYLYSIDMYAGDRGHGVEQFGRAFARLQPHRARNCLIRARFDEALTFFPDASLDFVYVDGYAHTGEEDGQTIRDWYPKVKPGGILAGDDYSDYWPLVPVQVDAFVAENNLQLHIINCKELGSIWSEEPTWFVRKPPQ